MKAQDQTMSFHDLRDALAQPGCPVCRLNAESAARFLDTLLWESVNDPERRREIRQTQGFCHEHAWRLVRAGASLGVAIIMRDVLQDVLRTMEGASFQELPTLSLRRAHEALSPKQSAAATAAVVAQLEPQGTCPACTSVRRMEGIYLRALLSNLLGEHGLLSAYEASDGLCLPHFRRALASVRDENVFEALMSTQRAIWGRLIAHLGEFIRKNDHRFRGEPWGDEADAWVRGIAALAGARPDEDKP
jgi:hypothetical protein